MIAVETRQIIDNHLNPQKSVNKLILGIFSAFLY